MATPDEATPDGPVELGIAAESLGDARLLTDLADRVLAEALAATGQDWFVGPARDGARCWRGVGAHEAFHDLHDQSEPASPLARRFHIHGDFGTGGLPPDTAPFRRVLLRFQLDATPPVAAVVIGRDSDHKRDLGAALEAALELPLERRWLFRVVLAAAHPEIEAWLLCGFEPANAAEKKRLAAMRQTLGFSPVESPERLGAGRNGAPRNCKRTFEELTQDDRKRCASAPLERLRARGAGCGLAPFLTDVVRELGPLFGLPAP